MLTTPDHDDAVTSPPAFAPVGPKPSGFWADCDPATGEEGTTFRAEEFNEAALNLRALLEAAGVAGTKGAATMLRDALHRLYAGNVRQVVATTTLTADYAGLVLVDAAAADCMLTLPAAAVCPQGSPALTFLRIDTSPYKVRLVAAAGDAIQSGALLLGPFEPLTLRSDGVLRWYVVSAPTTILHGALTLNVTPTGSDTPVDPLGGDPFQTLPGVFTYLATRILGSDATLTISVAAGTFVHTAPLDCTHPQAASMTIIGAGSAQTILRFDAVDGLISTGDLPRLQAVTIRGNGGTQARGVFVARRVVFDADVVIEQWSGSGIWMDPVTFVRVLAGQTLKVRQCVTSGVTIGAGAFFEASLDNTSLELADNGENLICYGQLGLWRLRTDRGGRGLHLIGSLASANLVGLDVRDATITDSVVLVESWARLAATGAVPAWFFGNAAGTVYHTLRAHNFGEALTVNALNGANRAITSPAVNTRGNIEAYIQAN